MSPRRLTVLALALAIAFAGGAEPAPADADAWTRVFLNGQLVPVSFNDGDSFRPHGGDFSGSQCRLTGFNALESFGPGHQWGSWHPYELYVLAKLATIHARRGVWHCFTDGSRDGYQRLLVDCPDLAVSEISMGYAHAYQIDDTPTRPEYARAQREAIEARRGMWAHGVPDYVMTSVHSAHEDPQREWHYNRLVSTHDGHTESIRHHDSYGECDWICNEETRADERMVEAAARRMREDPQLAPLLVEWQNFHLLEFVRRFVRRGELPQYLTGAAREPIAARLAEWGARGELGGTHVERGACMIYVEFERRYGQTRAACVTGHGTLPDGVTTGGGL